MYVEGRGGDYVSATMLNGKAHGIGTNGGRRKNFYYHGTYVNGMWHGYGRLFSCLSSLSYYEGEFRNGLPEGKGKYYFWHDE